jgi:uncharacterized protein YukE
MSQYLGQIPEEVDALANEFGVKADEIDQIISAVSAKLGSTTWTGPDRDRFEADWNGQLTAALRNVGGSLRDAQSVAKSNAEQQRTASS